MRIWRSVGKREAETRPQKNGQHEASKINKRNKENEQRNKRKKINKINKKQF